MRRTALQRLGKISIMISRKPMSRMDLINRLELIFEHKFSPSQIEKDIFSLKMEFDAPIKYDYDLRAYKMIEEYDFKEALYNFIDV
jgi:hypothetical protein